MFFDVELPIPANTSAAAPASVDVEFPPGTITQVDVQFPRGCAGLVSTYCQRGAHQVWPTNPAGRFRSDGYNITWQDAYDLIAAPFTLRLFGFSTDDTYAHTVTWRFSVRELPANLAAIVAGQQLAAIGTIEVGP